MEQSFDTIWTHSYPQHVLRNDTMALIPIALLALYLVMWTKLQAQFKTTDGQSVDTSLATMNTYTLYVASAALVVWTLAFIF